jgi:hypothetical protein
MPNYNEKTGIPYGVLSGNNCPELLDDIMSSGDSLTYAAWKQELAEKIKGAIASAIDDYTTRAAQIAADSLDYGEIVDSLLDGGLGEDYQQEEEEFEYSYDTPQGKVKLLMGWLGGAPLVWVCESPYYANCKGCSPCVPGAGDLDSPCENGLECYCLPPDDMPEEWEGVARLIADSPAPDCTDERAGREP